jgi:hypothetical protein
MASRTSSTNPATVAPEPPAGVLTSVTHVVVARAARRTAHRPAFSILESLMASVVLAIAVVGIAGPLAASAEQAEMIRERGTALVLARQLLEEIAAKPLCDGGVTCHLGPETGAGETSRDKYDSADDYHGYHDSTDRLTSLAGQTVPFTAGATYARDVTVEYRATLAGNAATSGDFGLVTVAVTTPHRQVISICRLLTRTAQTF